MNATPACPSWCEKHFPTTPDSHAAVRRVGPVSVMLVQVPGRQEPRLAVGGAMMDLTEARLLENLMGTLGHEDIGAVIAELAGLAA